MYCKIKENGELDIGRVVKGVKKNKDGKYEPELYTRDEMHAQGYREFKPGDISGKPGKNKRIVWSFKESGDYVVHNGVWEDIPTPELNSAVTEDNND